MESVKPEKASSPFLLLPVEIRLRIYKHIHFSHALVNTHLATYPSISSTIASDCTETQFAVGKTRRTSTLFDSRNKYEFGGDSTRSANNLSISHQVCGHLPTSLLTTCSQVYEESHHIPWHLNQFTFANWFSSGMHASRQFMRSLTPWQAASIRHVGIEVLTRDIRQSETSGLYGDAYLTSEEADRGRTEWEQLCWLWKGVWTLKLVVKGNVVCKHAGEIGAFFRPEEAAFATMMMETMGFEASNGNRGVLDVNSDWVMKGLCEMHCLRWIALEIEDDKVTGQEKLTFCQDLEAVLNQHGEDGESPIRVRLFEKEVVPPVSNKAFKWIGGPPGDDSLDGS